MDLYQRMSDRSMAKLYWIARHCSDFATGNEILQALRQRIDLGAERPKRASEGNLACRTGNGASEGIAGVCGTAVGAGCVEESVATVASETHSMSSCVSTSAGCT